MGQRADVAWATVHHSATGQVRWPMAARSEAVGKGHSRGGVGWPSWGWAGSMGGAQVRCSSDSGDKARGKVGWPMGVAGAGGRQMC